jgi:2-amino-4-hydroxy-6-hydroxymethyldihydropteridine diphosphokinase
MREKTEKSGVTVYLGLGSSLGNRAANLRRALSRLDAPNFHIAAVSSWFESPHLGLRPEDAERYPSHLNGVAKAETTLAPLEVLAHLRAVENAGGRQRTEHWGPRTIDIDLLLYGDLTLRSDELTLPHPGILERAFVLRPLAELAPDLRLPNGAAISERLDAPEIASQKLEIVTKK